MSHEFFYKTDLLMVLKTQINHAETLHNLCLVSRLFNSVFTEKLYDRLPCKGRKFQLLCDKEKCDLLLQYNKLSHTQTITVDHDSGLKVQDWCQLNSNLAKVIAKSRGNLTTFKSNEILFTQESMEALLSADKLQCLSITLPYYITKILLDGLLSSAQRAQSELYPLHMCLPQFKNLRSLSVVDIMGDLGEWEDTIVHVLVTNPQLEHLRLSICEVANNCYDEAVGAEEYEGKLFWGVCFLYAKRQDIKLKLKTLELGAGLAFPCREILLTLTEVEYLEVIYIYNDRRFFGFDVPWDILHPLATPRLRHLILHCLDDAVCVGMKDLLNFRAEQWAEASLRVERHIDTFEVFEFGKSLTGEGKERCISSLFTAEPMLMARQVMFPGVQPKLYGEYKLCILRACSWITHLVVPIGRDPGEDASLDVTQSRLVPVYNMIEGMAGLYAIWLPDLFCGEDTEIGDEPDYKQNRVGVCEPYLRRIAEACSTIKYVRLGASRWHIQRITTSEPAAVVFEEIDEREWEVGGPEFFQDKDVKAIAYY